MSPGSPFAARAHVPALAERPKDNDAPQDGDVARVLVGGEGFVRVSASSLADSLGVSPADVNSAISGGALSISHGGAAVAYEVDGDGVVFFAAAPDGVFSDVRHYFVRLTGGARSLGTVDGAPATGAHSRTYAREIHLERDEFPGTVVVEDPRSDFWFWHVVSSTSSFETEFELDAAAAGEVQLDVGMHAVPNFDATVSLWLDGTMVGEELLALGATRLRFDVAASLLGAGVHSLEVRASTGFAYVNEIDVRIPSQLGADGALFSVAEDSVLTALGGDGDRVFDVTDPRAPQLLTGLAFVGGELTFQAIAGHRYLVDRGDTQEPVRVQGASPNDISGDLAADYLVIAHRSLLGALEPLLDARRVDGFAALAVDAQDIYDEYAAGVADPEALRALIRDARDSWSVAPRYVLIAGHGTFDFRDVRGMGDNLVPGAIVRTSGGLFASDALLVSDPDSGPQLPIGRLPARTAGELSEMIGRILAYEGREHGGLLAVSDRPSLGDDFVRSAELAGSLAPTGFRVGYVSQLGDAVADARSALFGALSESPDAVMYFGHGGLDRIGRDGILRIEDLPSLSDAGLPAIHFTLSCSVGRFDVPGFESLGEELTSIALTLDQRNRAT